MIRFLKRFAFFSLALCLASLMGLGFCRYLLPFQLPEVPYSTIILDRNNEEIGEILTDAGLRHRPLDAREIPSFFKTALIETEDRSFYSNVGISIRGFGRALVADIQAGRIVEWGSTLSMGLVRNSLWLNEWRSFSKKILEILYALRLNGSLSKDQILTEYANRIAYGRLSVGIASAAKSYFGKEVRNLTDAESLALVTMAKNPDAFDPTQDEAAFRKRFEFLANSLRQRGVISEEKYQEILHETLAYPRPKQALPYVTDFLKKTDWTTLSSQVKNGILRTTFDRAFTESIERSSKEVLSDIAWKNVTDYGILIVDRESNEIRTMIGWVDYSSFAAWQVNSVLAARQVGSTMKPFTYLLAFEKFGYTAESPVLDLPVGYETSEGNLYEPKNYSLDYRGPISMGEALAGSVNIPAVRMLSQVGVGSLLDFMRTLGVTSLRESADHYGLSLTLWTGEISLFELLQAYTIFPNKWDFCTFQYISENSEHSSEIKQKSCKHLVDHKYTNSIENILTNRAYKLHSFPEGSALDFPDRFAFVKTGTSRNFRDNWAIGYTNRYLIGVWTGNKDGDNMKWVSGATGAWEIFGRLVRVLEPIWWAPKTIAPQATSQLFLQITSPLNHSKYILDSTKPEHIQDIKTSFKTNYLYSKAIWHLDGQSLPKEHISIPSLSIGKHTLSVNLFNDKWERIASDSVTFEHLEPMVLR